MMGDRKGKEVDGEGSDWDSMSETAQPPQRAQPATVVEGEDGVTVTREEPTKSKTFGSSFFSRLKGGKTVTEKDEQKQSNPKESFTDIYSSKYMQNVTLSGSEIQIPPKSVKIEMENHDSEHEPKLSSPFPPECEKDLDKSIGVNELNCSLYDDDVDARDEWDERERLVKDVDVHDANPVNAWRFTLSRFFIFITTFPMIFIQGLLYFIQMLLYLVSTFTVGVIIQVKQYLLRPLFLHILLPLLLFGGLILDRLYSASTPAMEFISFLCDNIARILRAFRLVEIHIHRHSPITTPLASTANP
ncbi:unnamed protein product [Darwinula stevensoni]|uniref:Uncharacterized protein n=1 Tax=Darwinula stevensoni TaxID=69355 RepID=A0A7R8XKN7_9CRUS|nr:unnamed protein product [Darwinula stevensoni]CAG0895934.1 unnamed protein product [Darwinula stevensoni]